MASSLALSITLLQVVQGGTPEDDPALGFQLTDLPDPSRLSMLGSRCACERTALFHQLWEVISQHDRFSPNTDIWLRTVDPDNVPPLPPGARLLDQHTVMFGVD
ncbi:hypothetical protein RIF23_19990 [Lipingzhangella sp. LS1_29]|uniref:Uncharacterized protein n=1 Tax=Lipingzhangella rawalii TaxID=2055835 RepID=A0ABU2HCJ0_9ACTN|nr:hypothetical protein [Lipingzhangella rawalii]MDS1272574.1 hypothetical protein [Lipingzhangella rawalii]